ncbi:Aldo/keto reductase [Clavulina sp. PMI_390]|nr:Aldo/keto reductase [Clavulina sp. PMI_390]
MIKFPLLTGETMPAIGLGTWGSNGDEGEAAIEYAVQSGYRLFDLSSYYGNQDEVGRAFRKLIPAIVKREDLCILGKLWNASHRAAAAETEFETTLEQLGLEYLDVYLMHWPVAMAQTKPPIIDHGVTVVETWLTMQKFAETGKVKTLGVSNFNVEQLKKLVELTGIKPAVNQIEIHPYFSQPGLVEYCQSEGIHVMAYLPMGGRPSVARLLADPVIKELTEKYPGTTPANIVLNWGVGRGYSVIPKSVKQERISSNLKLYSLTPEDMQKINGLNENKRIVIPHVLASLQWPIDVFGEEAEKHLETKVIIE